MTGRKARDTRRFCLSVDTMCSEWQAASAIMRETYVLWWLSVQFSRLQSAGWPVSVGICGETKCFLRMTHDEVQTILSLLPKTHIEYKSLIIEETLPIIQSLSRKVLFAQVCVCVCYMSVHSCGNTWLEVTLSPHKQTQLSQHNCFA